jgi:glycosyltransferase involved in cell wall biosynthesis
MTEAVALAAEHDSEIELNIIGRWDEDVVEACLSRLPADSRRHVRFRGHMSDVDEWLLQASLYLQCSRGDASPTAALEAMTAGVVPLVSEWTGVRQIVQEIDTRLIAPLRADEIAARILWYFGLESGDRLALSRRSREAVSGYTEEAAVEHYQRTFAALSRDLGLTTQAA